MLAPKLIVKPQKANLLPRLCLATFLSAGKGNGDERGGKEKSRCMQRERQEKAKVWEAFI